MMKRVQSLIRKVVYLVAISIFSIGCSTTTKVSLSEPNFHTPTSLTINMIKQNPGKRWTTEQDSDGIHVLQYLHKEGDFDDKDYESFLSKYSSGNDFENIKVPKNIIFPYTRLPYIKPSESKDKIGLSFYLKDYVFMDAIPLNLANGLYSQNNLYIAVGRNSLSMASIDLKLVSLHSILPDLPRPIEVIIEFIDPETEMPVRNALVEIEFESGFNLTEFYDNYLEAYNLKSPEKTAESTLVLKSFSGTTNSDGMVFTKYTPSNRNVEISLNSKTYGRIPIKTIYLRWVSMVFFGDIEKPNLINISGRFLLVNDTH